MYKLLDEKSNLWSCSLADLKAAQAASILSHWEVGTTLNDLTLFYEPETQRVILNADNAAYTRFETLAIKYLSADEEIRDRERLLQELRERQRRFKTGKISGRCLFFPNSVCRKRRIFVHLWCRKFIVSIQVMERFL